MKMLIVGSLSKDDVKDLKGQPVILITATPEEIRSVGHMLYSEVSIAPTERPAPLACDTGAEKRQGGG